MSRESILDAHRRLHQQRKQELEDNTVEPTEAELEAARAIRMEAIKAKGGLPCGCYRSKGTE
jgi:hypothetical protein